MAPQAKFADVNGVKLHYLTAGTGDPIVLLHGFAETSRMWLPLIAKLSDKHTVIAPDLRGFGQSSAPADGYTKAAMAQDIHELMKGLGYDRIRLVGHDIRGRGPHKLHSRRYHQHPWRYAWGHCAEHRAGLPRLLPGVRGYDLFLRNDGMALCDQWSQQSPVGRVRRAIRLRRHADERLHRVAMAGRTFHDLTYVFYDSIRAILGQASLKRDGPSARRAFK